MTIGECSNIWAGSLSVSASTILPYTKAATDAILYKQLLLEYFQCNDCVVAICGHQIEYYQVHFNDKLKLRL